MLLLRKDNNYNYPKFKSEIFYTNRLTVYSHWKILYSHSSNLHSMITAIRDSSICLCKWVICLIITFMGKFLLCLSIYSYKWSQYLFPQRNIHLCRLFVLHLTMMYFWSVPLLFFLSVLLSALCNSFGWARTFLECSRDYLFVSCCLLVLRFQFSHGGEEMLSKFLLSYFICKYVFEAGDLCFPRN